MLLYMGLNKWVTSIGHEFQCVHVHVKGHVVWQQVSEEDIFHFIIDDLLDLVNVSKNDPGLQVSKRHKSLFIEKNTN